VLFLSERVKVLDLIKEKKTKSYAEAAKIYVRINLLTMKL
jgi:hypothetical protein